MTRAGRVLSTLMLIGSVAWSGSAFADIKVGVLASLTGPGTGYGIPFERAYSIAEKEVAGEKITYIVMDDGSDPSRATRNARKMIQEHNVDAIVGFNGVQIPRAVLPLLKEFKVPAMSGAPMTVVGDDAEWFVSVVQPVSTWMVPVIEDMVAKKVKTVGFVGYTDNWGDDAYKTLTALGKAKGISVVADERYARGDTSTTPQVLKVVSKSPDAVFVGAGSTGAALPMLDLAKLGFKGPSYHTNAVIVPQFLDAAGKAAEGTYGITGAIGILDQLPDTDPNKKVAMDFIAKYNAKYGQSAANPMAGYAYDTSLVLNAAAKEALKTAKPGTPQFRAALRDAMHKVSNLPGVHATYNFKEGTSDGVGPESAILIRVVNGRWTIVK